MTLGDAAEPLVHIKDFRMDFADKTVIKAGPLIFEHPTMGFAIS